MRHPWQMGCLCSQQIINKYQYTTKFMLMLHLEKNPVKKALRYGMAGTLLCLGERSFLLFIDRIRCPRRRRKNFSIYDLIFADYVFIFSHGLALSGFEC